MMGLCHYGDLEEHCRDYVRSMQMFADNTANTFINQFGLNLFTLCLSSCTGSEAVVVLSSYPLSYDGFSDLL